MAGPTWQKSWLTNVEGRRWQLGLGADPLTQSCADMLRGFCQSRPHKNWLQNVKDCFPIMPGSNSSLALDECWLLIYPADGGIWYPAISPRLRHTNSLHRPLHSSPQHFWRTFGAYLEITLLLPGKLWSKNKPDISSVRSCTKPPIAGRYSKVSHETSQMVPSHPRSDTTLHYTTLHYPTLHYTTLHYPTLHYTIPQCTTVH